MRGRVDSRQSGAPKAYPPDIHASEMTEKIEIGIVSGPTDSTTTARFRVVKVPKASLQGDRYTVLMPGSLPSGLHFSEHASGAVHLRATTGNGVITLDLIEVARRLAEVGPGPMFKLVYRPPSSGHKASGLILPGDAAKPIATPGHTDIDAARIAESLVGFELEDSGDALTVLRELSSSGVLHSGDFVQILVPEIDECTFYIPLSGPFPNISDGEPFAADLRKLLAQITAQGGVFMTMGGPPEILAEMRQIPGCDLVFDFVDKLGADLKDPSQTARIAAGIMPFVTGLQPSIESAAMRGVLPTVRSGEKDETT
jgi:hypothetical protein